MARWEGTERETEMITRLSKLLPELTKLKVQVNDALVSVTAALSLLIPTNARSIIELIRLEVLDYYSITREELEGTSREGDIMRARHIYCAMAYWKTSTSYAQVGITVNRDHSSVVNNCKTVQKMIDTNDALGRDYKVIEAKVTSIITELKLAR